MWDALTEELSSGLAKTWTSRDVLPAVVFWGAVYVVLAEPTGAELRALAASATPAEALIASIGALALATTTAFLVGCVRHPVIRLLEGYWWDVPPLNFLRTWCVDRQVARKQALEREWNELAEKLRNKPSPGDLDAFGRADARAKTFPERTPRLLPTRFGNLIRAAEDHAEERYGLSATVTWPHLWLLLPETTRKELAAARTELNHQAGNLLLASAFALCTPFDWRALPIAVVVSSVIFMAMRRTAGAYAKLIRAAYDLHRMTLYDALGRSRPARPEEVRSGRSLTMFLHRGLVPGLRDGMPLPAPAPEPVPGGDTRVQVVGNDAPR